MEVRQIATCAMAAYKNQATVVCQNEREANSEPNKNRDFNCWSAIPKAPRWSSFGGVGTPPQAFLAIPAHPEMVWSRLKSNANV